MVLTRIPGLPASVVGVEAREKVTAEDHETVLIPAVEAAAAVSSDGKVRVLYVLGREFPDFTAGALWAHTKLALGPPRRWERIAVVSDAVWLRRAIRVVGWAIPGDVRVYASDQLNDARVWVTSPRQVSGARRFVGDVLIGFRVLNEVRHRVLAVVFGAQRGWHSNVVTIIVLASAWDAIHRVIAAPGAQVRKARSSPTIVGDSLIAAGVLSEVIDQVTTRRAKATASTAALIVFAVVVHSIRRPVLRSVHASRATIRAGITEVRKVRDAISRYGAEIVGGDADADLAGSPSGAGGDGLGGVGG
ncbi:MAG: STAS/SEC14 domain-containing protein [Solirubrobacteraceae bacterium]